MIDKVIFLPSAFLGLLCAGIYGLQCWRSGTRFELGTMVTLILNAAGVVAGALLIASTFSADLRARLSGLDLYILIGGVAVLVVSALGVLREIGPNRTRSG